MRQIKLIVASCAMVLTVSFAANSFGPIPFSDFDGNSDGVITQNEYQKTKELRMQEKKEEGRLLRNADKTNFNDIDTNNDGKVTQEEFNVHQQKMFNNRPNGKGFGQNR